MAAVSQIKPFILKTETYVDKAPRRDVSGTIVTPPNEAGKGPWTISLIKPSKRAPQPTEVIFKRQIAVPNPRLLNEERKAVAEAMSRGMIISANMVANNDLDYGNAPVLPQMKRGKSEYGRHLLGNFGPAPLNVNDSAANNLANLMGSHMNWGSEVSHGGFRSGSRKAHRMTKRKASRKAQRKAHRKATSKTNCKTRRN